MSCLAIIPAKGHSERLPGKNMKMFKGKPLVRWAIDCAFQARIFEEIIISSEDHETLQFARRGPWTVRCHTRYFHLANSGIPLTTIIMDCLAMMCHRYDEFCVLLPTSPLRTPSLITAIYESFKNQKSPCLMTFGEHGGKHDGTAIFCKTEAFLKKPDFYALDPAYYLVPKHLSHDIDTEEDFIKAEGGVG